MCPNFRGTLSQHSGNIIKPEKPKEFDIQSISFDLQ